MPPKAKKSAEKETKSSKKATQPSNEDKDSKDLNALREIFPSSEQEKINRILKCYKSAKTIFGVPDKSIDVDETIKKIFLMTYYNVDTDASTGNRVFDDRWRDFFEFTIGEIKSKPLVKPRIIVISGHPGCGKSSIVNFVMEQFEGSFLISGDQSYDEQEPRKFFGVTDYTKKLKGTIDEIKKKTDIQPPVIIIDKPSMSENQFNEYKKYVGDFDVDFVRLEMSSEKAFINNIMRCIKTSLTGEGERSALPLFAYEEDDTIKEETYPHGFEVYIVKDESPDFEFVYKKSKGGKRTRKKTRRRNKSHYKYK